MGSLCHPVETNREEVGAVNYPFDYNKIEGFGVHSFANFYERVVEECPLGSTLVEIGCYHGRSLVQLAMCAKAANKGIKVLGFDHCKGQSEGLKERVLDNIQKTDVGDMCSFFALSSLDAAEQVANSSCWMVFLDGDHGHEAVAADIDAWMPRVTKDGILAGHDAVWYSVWEPLKAKLPSVIHDPLWDDCWFAPKQQVRPTNEVDIRQSIRVEGKPGSAHFGYGEDGFRNDGKPSGSRLLA